MTSAITFRKASRDDIPLILSFIKDLAEYEKLSHEVEATEEKLEATLFEQPLAGEVIFGSVMGEDVVMALFFHNYSTFLAKPGLYLEDLYVRENQRGKGYGKAMLVELARIAKSRGCGRFEWSVLDWNSPAIHFYESLGAKPMDGWTTYRLTGNALDALAAME